LWPHRHRTPFNTRSIRWGPRFDKTTASSFFTGDYP
jgi:hypothetical protein